MSNLAGKPLNQAELNRVWGGIAHDFMALLSRVRVQKLILDQFSSVNLAALPPGGAPAGFDSGDADNIKSTAGDLLQLVDIAEGAASIGSAKDFRAFAKRLTGFEGV